MSMWRRLAPLGFLLLASCSDETATVSDAKAPVDRLAAVESGEVVDSVPTAGGVSENSLSPELTTLIEGFSSAERGQANPLSGDAESIEKGRSEYQSMCFVCHGASGKGDGPASKATPRKPSDLSDPVRAGLLSSGDRFLVLRHGIPGTSMPASGANLSDDQVWRIVTFVETLSK